MDTAPAQPLLGVTAGAFEVHEREALKSACLALASQARRTLDIVSRHLDPALYDDEGFVEAVKRLALGHRAARVRLFILDSRPLVAQGHRLIDLALKLTTFIDIRTPARQHQEFNEAWLVADNTGYAHRQFSDRYAAEVDFNGRRRAAALTERLDDMWERGQRDANFRRLHL